MANLIQYKKLYIATFIFGAMGVVLGAFGAHWLAEILSIKQLSIYKTGVLYHFIHVIAALCVLNIVTNNSNHSLRLSVYFFLVGVLLFSGSLYLLATRDILGISSYTWLFGPITPIGGVFFIAGWLNAAISFLKE